MWLINTTTLALHEFLPETTPPYGILSHRWESVEQEVSFKEFRKSRGQDTKGYMKIENFCKLLQEHDIDWAWVDTCCIDKRSSAEISEAINSMYRYYKNASTCYVYLKDASCGENDWLRSEWWRRGWTLQELVAASPVFFYDCNWKYISSKHSARETIAQCTRIPEDILSGQCRPRVYTAAQKMSWASCRETTRVEDMAYCMLGLFDINMPLLYGEGENAFRRLQLEILQKDADESLFAWNSTLPNSGEVLALLPAFFKDCTDMQPMEDLIDDDGDEKRKHNNNYRKSPTRATPWGIEITTNATKLLPLGEGERCRSDEQVRQDSEPFHLMAITLTTSRHKVRELPCTLILVPLRLSGRYLRHQVLRGRSDDVWRMLRERYSVQRQAEAQLYLHYDMRSYM